MTHHPHTTGAMWGGRFDQPPDALFRAFNDSLSVDWRLVHHDITASIAWANALSRAGLLSDDQARALTDALARLLDLARATPDPPTESGAEDVHSWVEQRLVDALGDLGKTLHTGRSRNDQVATDLRLWTRDAVSLIRRRLGALRGALLDAAERAQDIPMPAFTHLQPAQPVLAAHWFLAYEEMFTRDDARLRDALPRINLCPLGSAALAGSAFPVDRHRLAQDLGFDAPTSNSLDAVADRDFALETLAALDLIALHLSRLAEECVVFSSPQFALLSMDDAVTSGSSIMPQKKNPDAAELIRAKAARIAAARAALWTTIKALPLAYNKDLQEDKHHLFDAVDQCAACLDMAARLVQGLRLDPDRCRRQAQDGYANATDLADLLARLGVPFRDAHHAVGRIVRHAIERNLPLEALPIESLRRFAPQLPDDAPDHLALDAVLARRDVFGGTAPHRVRQALRDARRRLTQEAPDA